MCTVSYNVQEKNFAVHIVYYHMLMNILVVGTQNSTVCKLTPNWQGSPFFSQILYYILLCMLFLMNSFAHTHGHI